MSWQPLVCLMKIQAGRLGHAGIVQGSEFCKYMVGTQPLIHNAGLVGAALGGGVGSLDGVRFPQCPGTLSRPACNPTTGGRRGGERWAGNMCCSAPGGLDNLPSTPSEGEAGRQVKGR
jgi:hypothetical protein